jgi:ADP-heptose:LPS heptosyltransferase
MSSELANFYLRTRAARKIIVVDLGFLGDTLHLIPALWEIERHYPQAELHVVSSPLGAETLGLAPCVDRAWSFPLGPPSPPWWRHWDVVRAMRRERFDLAFNLNGADRSIFVTAALGTRWRVAHEGGRKHFWNSWLIPQWVARRSTKLAVYEQRRQALAACGLELDAPRWDLRIPEAAVRRAESLVPSGAIHFSVNASGSLKEWPLPHWIELARGLLERNLGLKIVATGSAAERETARLRELARAVNQPGLQTLSGLSVSELAAVLARCSQHIGADSGVLHLAMALGVPTFSIFREYPGLKEWLPRGPQHRYISADCPCARQKHATCTDRGVAVCLAGITPELVARALCAQAAT